MWSRDLEARLTQTRGHDGPAAADLVLPQLGRAFLPVQGSAACKIDACRCGAFQATSGIDPLATRRIDPPAWL